MSPTLSDRQKSMPGHLQNVGLDILETILPSLRACLFKVARQRCRSRCYLTVAGAGLSNKAKLQDQKQTQKLDATKTHNNSQVTDNKRHIVTSKYASCCSYTLLAYSP